MAIDLEPNPVAMLITDPRVVRGELTTSVHKYPEGWGKPPEKPNPFLNPLIEAAKSWLSTTKPWELVGTKYSVHQNEQGEKTSAKLSLAFYNDSPPTRLRFDPNFGFPWFHPTLALAKVLDRDNGLIYSFGNKANAEELQPSYIFKPPSVPPFLSETELTEGQIPQGRLRWALSFVTVQKLLFEDPHWSYRGEDPRLFIMDMEMVDRESTVNRAIQQTRLQFSSDKFFKRNYARNYQKEIAELQRQIKEIRQAKVKEKAETEQAQQALQEKLGFYSHVLELTKDLPKPELPQSIN